MSSSDAHWTKDPKNCAVIHDYVAHFSNPVRLRLLCTLMEGRASVSDLVAEVGEKQPNVSQQLKLLLVAGMVRRTREGTRQIYEIANPLVGSTLRHLAEVADALQAAEDGTTPPSDVPED